MEKEQLVDLSEVEIDNSLNKAFILSIPSSTAIFSNCGGKSLIFNSIKYPPIKVIYIGYSTKLIFYLLK